MDNSRRLREAVHHTLQQTENDLKSQHTATDYAYRKRVHEFERAIDELNWQKQQVFSTSVNIYHHTVIAISLKLKCI